MDYPKSTPGVGLVNGQFADENPSTGAIGSLIPASWGNAVTQEILAVVNAAGLSPSEADLNQLLTAIQVITATDAKRSVRCATTGAIALSGLQTIDGVALAVGDRVLVKNQATASQNWIYVAVAGAWARAQDANESIECIPGHTVPVQDGNVNAGTVWQLINTSQPVLGTTALTFAQVGGKSGVAPGAYGAVTVDAFGRVVAGSNPATLAGHGIGDAFTKAQTGSEILAALGAAGWGEVGKERPGLGANVDLNTVRTPGSHGQSDNLSAQLALNYPVEAAGTLLVQAANVNITTQIYTQYNTARTWFRARYVNDWTRWFEVASTELVQAAITALVGGAPATLDTLKKLAAALGNDPNFATTTASALAGKAAKATTLAGYGITDAYTSEYTNILLNQKAWAATSLEGYGILDAYNISTMNLLLSQKASVENVAVVGFVGGAITEPYLGSDRGDLVRLVSQAQLPRNTCVKGVPGWWMCADTGLLRQRVAVYIGDAVNIWTGAVTWPVTFPVQADSVKISVMTADGSVGQLVASYSSLTRTGCKLRVEEWGGLVQTGLQLIVEAEGY